MMIHSYYVESKPVMHTPTWIKTTISIYIRNKSSTYAFIKKFFLHDTPYIATKWKF